MITRVLVMLLLVPLGTSLFGTREAAAQSACVAKCQGASACIEKCASARKSRAQARQGTAPPRPSSSAAGETRRDNWQSTIFNNSTGGGGGGGGGY
jgi:hypothetical protein